MISRKSPESLVRNGTSSFDAFSLWFKIQTIKRATSSELKLMIGNGLNAKSRILYAMTNEWNIVDVRDAHRENKQFTINRSCENYSTINLRFIV